MFAQLLGMGRCKKDKDKDKDKEIATASGDKSKESETEEPAVGDRIYSSAAGGAGEYNIDAITLQSAGPGSFHPSNLLNQANSPVWSEMKMCKFGHRACSEIGVNFLQHKCVVSRNTAGACTKGLRSL